MAKTLSDPKKNKHLTLEDRNSFTSSDEPCPLLLKAPFVCNGCQKRSSSSCHFVHYLYRASSAQSEYRQLLTDAREDTPLNREEFYRTDRIISDALKRGQHLCHIMANSAEITCSKSAVYRHFHKGYYSASLMDLPRAVKFKSRKSPYRDYVLSGMKVGRPGGRVILTIHFTSCNFMAGLLLDDFSLS